MTVTTDNRTFVYAVFDADGYECRSLAGLFSTQQLADEAAAKLCVEDAKDWAERYADEPEWLPRNHRQFAVEPIEVDAVLAVV